MKILVVSDLHANLDAWNALTEEADELWVLGDLVNYGPEPGAVVEAVRARASVVVRGNHDHAMGYGEDPRCSARFREMAAEVGRYTAGVLTEEQKQYLRDLPLRAERVVDGVRFVLCHAVPSDPLYPYCLPDSPRWQQEIHSVEADVLLAGHTHIPFVREFADRTVVNPGSLGQPKTGSPEACYAVWEDGRLLLKTYPYPVERTMAKIRLLPIDARVKDALTAVLSPEDKRHVSNS
jgi:putative phosphoesterase